MYKKVFKRLLDIILSLCGIIALSIPMVIIAVIIKIDSKGPVFFKQKRVGLNKEYFEIIKFRTLLTETPKDVPTHELSDSKKWITKVGKILRRKSLDEISDNSDEKLVPAQFAPSASNTQPWYFTHNDDGSYDLYRVKLGRLRNRFYKKWNKIDTGIALAHLYVANEDSFRFYMKDNPKELKGLFYAGSFEI